MQVSSSSDNHYLCIARVAQVRSQLPLSGPVPAHVEEYLYDDEDDHNSVERNVNRLRNLVQKSKQIHFGFSFQGYRFSCSNLKFSFRRYHFVLELQSS